MLDLPPKPVFTSVEYHSRKYPYEFKTKTNRLLVGIIKKVNIEMDDYGKTIIYEVEVEGMYGNYFLVDHDTNTQI